ncbi:MAG: protease SohB [Deltaproteobacteria bacterium]|nr:MAG: protease SohB [Deltaproteobacteria bacterium]
MIDGLLELVFFAARLFLVAGVIGLLLLMVLRALRIRPGDSSPTLQVRRIDRELQEMAIALDAAGLAPGERRAHIKRLRKHVQQVDHTSVARVFVLDFDGDLQANPVDALRDEVSLLLRVVREGDQVLIRVQSAGGLVHGYGLAAAQLLRLRESGVPVTVAVDRIAASGGYMMAAVGHEIIAAPFAIIGSIGVLARVPNLHRLLERVGVDYEEMTAGEYKSTVSMLAEISTEGRRHFKEQLDDTHELFKSFLARVRPAIDLDQTANGAYWYGEQALEFGLVDRILTSDDWLAEVPPGTPILAVRLDDPVPLQERLSQWVSATSERVLRRVLDHAGRPPLP